MALRTPFVGETMHFYSFPPSTHPGPQAAIVAFHWADDESVNLMVIDPHGSVGTASGVPVVQPGEPAPEKQSYCEFIVVENEVAVSAKTEAAPSPYVAKPA